MAARPRWLVLTQYYPPEVGAPQIRLRAMVRELRRRGFDVEVLTAMPNYPAGRILPGYEGRVAMREQIDGVTVRRSWVYAGAGRSVPVRLANYLSFTATGTIAALAGRRPDVLFVEGQPLSLGLSALLMKALRGVPFIYNVPDLQVEVARQLGFLGNSWALHAAGRFERFVARHAWKVSTVTRQFVEHFEALGLPEGRVTFLPNGADTEFLRPQAPDPGLIERWSLQGKTTLLYVGTHAYYHGLETILDAAERLKERRDLTFLFVGHGPERGRLQEMARTRRLSNVIFGDSPYEERSALYSIAYASLATLRDIDVAQRMRPAKVFPSLSCGVPVIYSGRGEGAELLTRGACGIAVTPNDGGALAGAVERLVADPVGRGVLGRAGRALVEREYAWPTIVSNWLGELGLETPTPGGA